MKTLRKNSLIKYSSAENLSKDSLHLLSLSRINASRAWLLPMALRLMRVIKHNRSPITRLAVLLAFKYKRQVLEAVKTSLKKITVISSHLFIAVASQLLLQMKIPSISQSRTNLQLGSIMRLLPKLQPMFVQLFQLITLISK